jgi:hypothetical protein
MKSSGLRSDNNKAALLKSGSIVLARRKLQACDLERFNANDWIIANLPAIQSVGKRGSFAANTVRLQLHPLAYNLGNFMRTLAMPKTAEPWSLTSLREKPIKIGAKVVSHGPVRYLSDGRGRGAAKDVPGNPDAHRPVAGTTRTA